MMDPEGAIHHQEHERLDAEHRNLQGILYPLRRRIEALSAQLKAYRDEPWDDLKMHNLRREHDEFAREHDLLQAKYDTLIEEIRMLVARIHEFNVDKQRLNGQTRRIMKP